MKVILSTEWLDNTKARSVPGALYSKDDAAWIVQNPTPRAAAVALRLFPGLSAVYPDLIALRDSLSQEIRPFDAASQYQGILDAPEVLSRLSEQGFSFYDYQSTDLAYLAAVIKEHKAAYLGWDRGLGKTLASCALIDALEIDNALVVAPNTAKSSVWKPELEKWLPSREVVVLRNSKSQRVKDLAYCQQLQQSGSSFVLVAHYEAIPIVLETLNKLGFEMVIADEAHRIKNPKTQMSKALKKVKTEYKLALSGSIISNHAEELYSQLNWLFPKTYSSKWRDWNDRFLDFVDGGWGKVCVGVKIEKLDEMRQELGVFMIYREKEEVLDDLPDRQEQTLRVDLSPHQRRVYNQLRDEYVATLDSGERVAATDGLTLLGKLRQVASGLDILGESVEDSSKLDLAVEMIDDAEDTAFVVFTWWKATANALADRLRGRGIGSYIVTGDTKQRDRADAVRDFQAANGHRVFIGTLSTIGESITLHRASHALFVDQSWNPSDNQQAADRIYRIGQKNAVTITKIVAADTVDEFRVMPALADKEALRNMILGGSR